MDEYHLISTTRGGGGWSSERPILPQRVEDHALDILSDLLTTEKRAAFRTYLRLIFSSMVESEAFQQKHRPRITPPTHLGIRFTYPRRAKFGTSVRESLERYQKEYASLRRNKQTSDIETMRFIDSLEQNTAVFGLLETKMKSHGRRQLRRYVDPTRHRDPFLCLEDYFADAKLALDRSMKPGRSDPVFEQLARALASLYLECTGTRPGRTVIEIEKSREAGRFTSLCQCMAKAVYDGLQKEVQRDTPPKMIKVIRRISAELRAEIAA